jgi:PAS domain S-box-containing protein
MPKKSSATNSTGELRRRAEARLRVQHKGHPSNAAASKTGAGAARALHEMEVHQIELEMQNSELEIARNELEAVLEKYTDLYDFAPVGYFSLDDHGRILEVNLTGAALLRVERSRLVNRRLPEFVALASRPVLVAFMERIFAGTGKQVCEAALLRDETAVLWASFHGASAISAGGPLRWCRVAVSDITSIKQAQEAKRRAQALATENRALTRQIARREAVEEALKQSERHQVELLAESRRMQEQLRNLSRQVLRAQEKERQRISRELHDVIAQTLTGINVRLATLKKETGLDTKSLVENIARTQELVEKSVEIVHQFARELRPTVLDDLGLIPALHTFLKGFQADTGIQVSLAAAASVERVNGDKRTALFRVAQEALNNAARHAHASRIEISLKELDGVICMTIQDNGQGLPAERVLGAKKQKRLGLLGMKERMEMVGGSFSIESAPGGGAAAIARLPLRNTKPPARRGTAQTKTAAAKLLSL